METLPKVMSRAARLLVEHGIKNRFISKFFLLDDQMSIQAIKNKTIIAERKQAKRMFEWTRGNVW